MKMRYLILVLLVAVIAALVLWRHGNHSHQTSITLSNAPPVSARLFPERPAITATDDPHAPAIGLAQQWINAARLVNCDPIVTNVIERTNRRTGSVTAIQIVTPTHYVEVTKRSDGEMVNFASSHYGTDKTAPEYEAKWYQCTEPAWTEQQATAEAWATLERLGATQTLTRITRTNYEAIPLPLRTPEGTITMVTPFVNVSFLDAKDNSLMDAQYRMELSKAGLVRWWHWP
ncbi:MAG TPA: hypothetical protein VGF13_06615 [Verrucomicrobiae bacterium]|jgi:hypothetical protein